MTCGVTPNQLLPRRLVVRAGVASPLNCRHPKQLRCSCHGQPSEKPDLHRNTQSAARGNAKAAATSYADALRSQEQQYNDILASILKTIRRFPDAAAAVSAMLDTGGDQWRPDSDTGHA